MISGPRKRVDTPSLDSSGVLGKSLLSRQKMQIRSGYVSGGCHFRGSGPKLSICRRYDLYGSIWLAKYSGGGFPMISVYVLAAVVSLLLLALCRAEINKVQLARKTWEELLKELKPVRTEGITLTALECSAMGELHPGTDPNELWTMIGEWNGLKQMQANTGLLLALAGQARAWNHGGSTLVVERMRSDAIAMRRAALMLWIGQICGSRRAFIHVQETACAYYRLSERLLTLYETSPSRRYGQLTAAVWPYARAV